MVGVREGVGVGSGRVLMSRWVVVMLCLEELLNLSFL